MSLHKFQEKDRRKDLRVPVRLRVDETARTLSFYYSRDISRSGIFLETKLPLQKGTRVLLEFTLPGTNHTFRAWGTTMWIRKGSDVPGGEPAGMGIQFEQLAEEDATALDQFVRINK